jgi:hypothetical protein
MIRVTIYTQSNGGRVKEIRLFKLLLYKHTIEANIPF